MPVFIIAFITSKIVLLTILGKKGRKNKTNREPDVPVMLKGVLFILGMRKKGWCSHFPVPFKNRTSCAKHFWWNLHHRCKSKVLVTILPICHEFQDNLEDKPASHGKKEE